MKTLKYWVQHEVVKYDGRPIEHISQEGDYSKKEAEAVLEAMEEDSFVYQPATRNSHYTALNCLPCEPGTRWVISEEVYWEFMEMLPPLTRLAGGFFCPEAGTSCKEGNIRSAYYQSEGKYWHGYEVTKF